MKTARMELGKRGEDAVCEYLSKLGHKVVDRNWRSGRLEVDLITFAQDGLHFVEVKSRVAPCHVAPELSVTAAKQRRIIAAAKLWLHQEQIDDDLELFFDVATVIFDGGKIDIKYYPGAYLPLYI